MCKIGYGINNLQWLMCNTPKPNQTYYDQEVNQSYGTATSENLSVLE